MRLFTLEEANALVPRLEFIMERMQRCGLALRREIETFAQETGREHGEVPLPELLEHRPALRPLAHEMQSLVEEIESSGGQFKGFDLGLVDFPAEIDGEIGLLCWQFGEKEIGYWHRMDTGFASRQPLSVVAQNPRLQ